MKKKHPLITPVEPGQPKQPVEEVTVDNLTTAKRALMKARMHIVTHRDCDNFVGGQDYANVMVAIDWAISVLNNYV